VIGSEIRVEADRLANEVVDPADCLDTRKAATRYNEGQQWVAFAGGALSVGFLKMSDELITDRDRVAKRLDC
jgi:YD repeat-containing protein